jgi:hypothetical protein
MTMSNIQITTLEAREYLQHLRWRLTEEVEEEHKLAEEKKISV